MTDPRIEPKCKVCNSLLRPEADARLLAGESSRSIAAWLESAEGGVKVHPTRIANHRAKHLGVIERAKEMLAQSMPTIEAAAKKVVADVEVLDKIAERALKATSGDAPADMAGAVLYTGCLREARAAVVAKHEILNGKNIHADLNLSGLGELLGKGFDE